MDERRYFGLDALRGAMMMLGIILHSSLLYQSSPPPTMPIGTDHNTSIVFDVLIAFIHSVRMPVFFVLSGFFTALLVARRGVMGTYKNRAGRVLAPLLLAVVTVLPITVYFLIACMVSARFGTHAFLPEREQLKVIGQEMAARGVPDEPSLMHLWFLYYLLYFYLLIPLCRWLVQWSLRYEDQVRRFLVAPGTWVVLGLYTGMTLWPFRGGETYEGFIFLKPYPPALIYYGSFFVLGYVFHAYRDILLTFKRNVHWYAPVALVLFPLSFYASHLEYGASSQMVELHLAAVVLHGLATWALVYLFMGVALRFFDYESPWILYTSQSSYWVFLFHMVPVGFASWWMLQYDLPAVLKFLLVVAFATVLCLVTYHYAVQRTWVSVLLNGRRFDLKWPWRATASSERSR
jgi:glucan biosynthesis protein C